MNTLDGYSSVLSVILSSKGNEEIGGELTDLLGFENFDLISMLIEKRDIIQDQCRAIEENLKTEKSAQNYQQKNRDVNRPGIGVNVQIVNQKRGKGGKFAKVNN